jgi:alpha/beta hydrolase fold
LFRDSVKERSVECQSADSPYCHSAGRDFIALSIRRLRTLQRTPHSKWRRITERVLLSLVILLFVVAAGSTTFNAIALRYYRAIYPAPGKIYRVNGHDMHLYCTGEGSPTIVLEAGGENGFLKWAKVQTGLSKTTQVCSYDRAGFGWSTPGPDPRDAATIASELHALLQQAGVRGPLVLMGHSMAGIYLYTRLRQALSQGRDGADLR